MTLIERQSVFALNICKLIERIHRDGYKCSLGEAYRPMETARLFAKQGRGAENSMHTIRLAVDLNLFKDGHYLDDTESHRRFGEFWKSLHPDNGWGGDFANRKDGNHYEMKGA